MGKSKSRSGGFFLMVTILVGAGWGVAVGEPMTGILAGTTVGILTAIAIWLIDRSRRD
jgi:hypothetical protein